MADSFIQQTLAKTKHHKNQTLSHIRSFSEDELNYKISRMLFCLVAALAFFFEDLQSWSKVDPFFYLPVGAFNIFQRTIYEYFTAPILLTIKTLTVALLVFFSFQHKNWILSSLLFIFFYFVAGFANNFYIIDYNSCVLMLTVALLVSSDWALCLNLDRHKVYSWCIQSVKVLVVTIYFIAGFSQLRDGGLAWFTSDNLEVWILLAGKPAGLKLAAFPALVQFLSIAVVLINITSPLALFLKGRAALIYPVLWVCLQAGVHFFLAPNYLLITLSFVFWVPWFSFLHNRFKHNGIELFQLGSLKKLNAVTLAMVTVFLMVAVTQKELWPFSAFTMYSKNVTDSVHQRVLLYSHFEDNRRKLLRPAWLDPMSRRQLNVILKRKLLKENAPKRKTMNRLERLICKNLKSRNRMNATFKLYAVLNSFEKGTQVKTSKPTQRILARREVDCSKFNINSSQKSKEPQEQDTEDVFDEGV